MTRPSRRVIYVLAAVLVAVFVLWLAGRFSPAGRTKAYFALQRSWNAHWPFERGQHLVSRAEPLFAPLVPVRLELEPGVSMLLDPDDFISRTVLDTGYWKPETWSAIAQHLPAGGTFVDIGAHIGTYSLRAARAVGPQGHVISVEPNPETAQKLRENIQASGDANVRVVPLACSDTETDLELFAAPRSNTGATSLFRANVEQEGTPVSKVFHVRTRPLDAILRDVGVSRVDVLKIDAEGAEMLVLKSARETLARYSPVLSVELIDAKLKATGSGTAEVIAFLSAQGYKPPKMIEGYATFSK